MRRARLPGQFTTACPVYKLIKRTVVIRFTLWRQICTTDGKARFSSLRLFGKQHQLPSNLRPCIRTRKLVCDVTTAPALSLRGQYRGLTHYPEGGYPLDSGNRSGSGLAGRCPGPRATPSSRYSEPRQRHRRMQGCYSRCVQPTSPT
jgi:hypothetical protein